MMTREMMENLFDDYCRRYDLAWYELFDGDLFDSVMTEIATAVAASYSPDLKSCCPSLRD